MRGFAAELTDQQVKRLKKSPLVKFVEQNRRFKAFSFSPLHAFKPLAASLINNNYAISNQTIPWGITRVNGPLNGNGEKAWIIGTGIDFDNNDLNVDVLNAASFVGQENADDLNGHGTAVAGVLAAKNNSYGVVGVAAGASVVPIKVLDQYGYGYFNDVADGIDYAAGRALPSDVINLSLGSTGRVSGQTVVDIAVQNAADAGIHLVISAGNSSDDAAYYSPAHVDHSNVYTISAFDQSDNFVIDFSCNTNFHTGSNYGNPPIEYAGPGDLILTLALNGGTTTVCGTSFSAPHIAGLLLAADNIVIDGYVTGDPDSNPDPIAVAEMEVPLSVQIQSPGTVYSGAPAAFNTNVAGADGPVSYQWYYRVSQSDPWILHSGATGSSHTHTFYGASPPLQYIKVTVSSSGETDADVNSVYVQGFTDPCPPAEYPCEWDPPLGPGL